MPLRWPFLHRDEPAPQAPQPSRNEMLLTILWDEPNRQFTPRELAETLGCTTQQAASACWHLWKHGKVRRHTVATGNLKQSTYSHLGDE